MKYYIADFHIHSKYSRATSKNMDFDTIAKWAKIKGLWLVGTGDILHPQWFKEAKDKLREKDVGIFEYNGANFILTTEVSCVFQRGLEVKKIHIVLIFPNFESVEKLSHKLGLYGNLSEDGRPTLNIDTKDFIKIVKDTDEDIMIIPAHVWTPWYSLFGANSGFDSVEEAFGEYSGYITALETGLSSDPPMNWRLKQLDEYTLVSNSDAHSPNKLGREANVFSKALNFYEIKKIIEEKNKSLFLFTIEFFPQEGKYHYDGHRKCKVRFHPKETKKHGYICPVCGKKLTIGVLHRVEELSTREEGEVPENAIPCKHLIPLEQIIADVYRVGESTKTVEREYLRLVKCFGSEFEVLLNVPFEELLKCALNKRVAKAIVNVRNGKVKIEPGYDGVYGKISVILDDAKEEVKERISLFKEQFKENKLDKKGEIVPKDKGQLNLF